MKKVINLYENISTVGDKTIIYKGGIVKENLLSSILSDTYTYGVLLFSFWFNQQYINSRIINGILLFSFLFSLFYSTGKRIVSKEEFKEIMGKYLEEANENQSSKQN